MSKYEGIDNRIDRMLWCVSWWNAKDRIGNVDDRVEKLVWIPSATRIWFRVGDRAISRAAELINSVGSGNS